MKARELKVRIKQWYLDHFVPYITIQQSNEHFFVSRQLWKIIDNDLTQDQKREINIFFKYVIEEGKYLMIVNPDMRSEFEEGVIPEEAFEKEERRKSRKNELDGKPRSFQIIQEVKRINKVMKEGGPKEQAAELPQTFPLQLNPFGRIGFQGTQPSPAMIVYKYNLDSKIEKKYKKELDFTDRVQIKVIPVVYRPDVYGGRHAFFLTDCILGSPTKTFSKPFKRK